MRKYRAKKQNRYLDKHECHVLQKNNIYEKQTKLNLIPDKLLTLFTRIKQRIQMREWREPAEQQQCDAGVGKAEGSPHPHLTHSSQLKVKL